MNANGSRRPETLVVMHRGLLQRRDDTLEMEGHLVGLLRASGQTTGVRVLASDAHDVFVPLDDGDGGVVYAQDREFWPVAARGEIDILYVHMPVPLVHLVAALVARVRGATVVMSPMGMLNANYARSGWFRHRNPLSALAKRLAVHLVRMLWTLVAHWFVCLSSEEARSARLPAARCLVAPWAPPGSDLSAEVLAHDGAPCAATDAPVAFVSRMDPHRKGIDRLCRWLSQHADELPRPAVLLLAPPSPDAPPELEELERAGLIRWERYLQGRDLLEPLRSCRAVMLLSRWEAQSRSLREAMLLGLPVITTRPNLLTEAMALAGAGTVVDPDEPSDIQRAFWATNGVADAGVARRIFDSEAIGRFLLANFVEMRRHDRIRWRDYYLVQQAPALHLTSSRRQVSA